jgi:predicted dehydrogenase
MRYVRHIVEDLPDAALTAVCRQHPERGFAYAGATSVTLYGDARSLIADPNVKAVVVVTPPIYSREISGWAIQAGKPLLIEKPLATSAEDARAIVAAARQGGIPLMTAQTFRFDSTIVEMKQRRHLIGRSERLKLTSHIEMRNPGPGHAEGYGKRGAVLEIGIHLLDLVRFLTEEEVQDVRCTMQPIPPAWPEVVASAQLTTSGGTVCEIDIARVPEGRVGLVEWVGSRGRLDGDWIRGQLRWTNGTQVEEHKVASSHTVLATLAAFLSAISAHAPMPITGEDGARAVEIAEACYRSAQTGGQPIELSERD